MLEQAGIASGRTGKEYRDEDDEEKEILSAMETLDEEDGEILGSPLGSDRILTAVPEHTMPDESKDTVSPEERNCK